MTPSYIYRATVTRVVDGDTVDVLIDLGLHVHVKTRLRLYGINAPEPRGVTAEAGKASTAHMVSLIAEHGRTLVVKTHRDKRGKYGRCLAELLAGDVNLNDCMVRDGHAEVSE